VEIGYRQEQRLALVPQRVPFSHPPEAKVIEAGAVILVTGGARGITAEVARELARGYNLTLILCGSSPVPSEREAEDIRGIDAVSDLKQVLIARARQRGETPKPAAIEADYRAIAKQREIRNNLDAVRATGTEVEYHQVDVTDEEAFGRFIETLYQRFGRLDGVIHGAGIIEDKLIGDKSGDSFDRVVETKIRSSFVLSRYLRPYALKFLVFFTSVAGRFGNRGQSDYGVANEILSKLALDLDRRWPSRVVAISWGPWDKEGMVTAEIKRQFSERGIVAIPPTLGSQACVREIELGLKGEAEVVWGQGPWEQQTRDAQAIE
jgi:NAD(P)-dependent dehydrogenase (short-subunit alcohol dehydrogenase family)